MWMQKKERMRSVPLKNIMRTVSFRKKERGYTMAPLWHGVAKNGGLRNFVMNWRDIRIFRLWTFKFVIFVICEILLEVKKTFTNLLILRWVIFTNSFIHPKIFICFLANHSFLWKIYSLKNWHIFCFLFTFLKNHLFFSFINFFIYCLLVHTFKNHFIFLYIYSLYIHSFHFHPFVFWLI